MQKKLFLIDGFGLIYRAYFAFGARPLVTKDGQNVSALFGFFNSLIALLEREKPEHIAIILESTTPTFRHEMYSEYKATRQKMPDELRAQIPILLEMIKTFGVPSFYLDGYEADDLIATISRRAEEFGVSTFIYSADKDLAQLVTEHVKIYDPKSFEIIGREGVKSKFELYPEQIADFLALTGDASDNIPGVPKIGKKTAIELLNEFGSFENLYNNIEAVKRPAIKTTLTENRHLALLSLALTHIKTIESYEFKIENFNPQIPDKQGFLAYCRRYELNRLITFALKLPDAESVTSESDPRQIQPATEVKSYINCNLNEEEHFTKLSNELSACSKLFITYNQADKKFSTLSINASSDKIYQLEFSGAAAMQDDLFGAMNADDSTPVKIFELLLSFAAQPDKTIVLHNHKLFLKLSAEYNLAPRCHFFDTMLSAYCLDCGWGDYSLQAIQERNLHQEETTTEIISLIAIYEKQTSDLNASPDQAKLLKEIEIPLSPVLLKMENRGILTDSARLLQLSSATGRQMQEVAKTIFALTGEEFNLDSPKQLGTILFERLNLPHGRKGKSGNYSTDNAILTKLQEQGFPVAEHILVYREKAKLKNTYLDGLIKIINPYDNRIHTTYNQCVAATGRLSSSEPNLQSIPIRTEEGGRIRGAFKAPSGYTIVSADYSQIELRILAHYTQDTELIRAFLNGEDIHAHTASVLFNIPQNEVDRTLRSKAKIANFSVLYGKTVFGLAEDMQIPFAEAQIFIENYFAKFPGIKKYIAETEEYAERYGFVTTLFGRKRSIPEAKSPNKNVQNAALRMAVNTPIQGTAADVIKMAMLNISKKIDTFNAYMLLQVHDELIFEVKTEEVEPFKQFIKTEMEGVVNFAVPLEVNVGSGNNWLEAH